MNEVGVSHISCVEESQKRQGHGKGDAFVVVARMERGGNM